MAGQRRCPENELRSTRASGHRTPKTTTTLYHRTRKTSGRTGLCPEETTKISILSGRNRFIPDEILIEGQKIKTTGLLQATTLPTYTHIRKRVRPVFTGRTLRRTAATYSPTWSGSTIGDDGLSFSVRNGKRRFPVAIATAVYNLRENQRKKSSRLIFPERKISGY